MRRWKRSYQSLQTWYTAEQHKRVAAETRLHDLLNSDPYKAGFGDGVTVTIQQLHKWLTDCQESARQVIAASPVDHSNPDFRRGHDLASAWIAEAIEQLFHEVEDRAHEQQAQAHDDPR